MNLLVACEESQRVCIAFRNHGVNAFSCDLQPCGGGHPEWHFQGDALVIMQGGSMYTEAGTKEYIAHWDMLIAHPPCTYLSNAGNCALYENGFNIDRFGKMREAKEFFNQFYFAPITYKCIENPVANKLANLPKYTQIIHPHYFGSQYCKRTCLWLVNLPPLKRTHHIEHPTSCANAAFFNFGRGEERRKSRSKTFPEIAEAMASQWCEYLKREGLL